MGGIGEKKNLKKLHVTLMTLNASQEEMEMMETAFRSAGDRFTEITGEGAFLIGFKGLEVGDGEHPPVLIKVELGIEILNILRGVLEDELHWHITDARFTSNVTIFGGCTLNSNRRKELFKTADQETIKPISVRNMSLRQRQQDSTEQVEQRVTQYQF